MSESDKVRGFVAGLVAFVVLVMPWTIVAIMFLTKPVNRTNTNFTFFFSVLGIMVGISTSFGFSVAKKSRVLTVISLVLLVALIAFLYWGPRF